LPATVTYGWDASHFDGTLTKAILSRAKSQGIAFFTHKLGEGLSNVDPTAATALAAARSAGIRVLGGYWFLHGNDDAVASAKKCIAVADAHEPWWRDFPGWFWQTDAETSSTGLPSPAYVKKFSDTLANESGKLVIVYASRGMYGDRLSGIGHRLWNANYGSNPHGAFKSIYPGNGSAGWHAYSGHTPTLLQYGSNATIAGLTTCDANAFRGTIDELAAIIEGDDMPLSESDIAKIVAAVWNRDNITANYPWMPDAATNAQIRAISAVKDGADQAHAANVGIAALNAGLAAQAKQISALAAAVSTMKGETDGGGAGDGGTGIVDAIEAVGAQESDQVKTLQTQIDAMQGMLASANEALSAAKAALAAAQTNSAAPAPVPGSSAAPVPGSAPIPGSAPVPGAAPVQPSAPPAAPVPGQGSEADGSGVAHAG
jgi:GH25 family lysozyme M1 (1,4-beta-N-acetylmuramidase)